MATQKPAGTAQKPANTPARRGRKPAADSAAPHGRDANGKPLAPHGYLDDGVTPRVRAKRNAANVDLGLIAAVQSVSEEVAAAARPARERSDAQKAMDAVVTKLHKDWIEAGSPSEWKDIPKGRYHVDPEVASDLKFLISKAGDFLKVRIRYGKELRDANGKTVIVFGAVKKSTKTRKPKPE